MAIIDIVTMRNSTTSQPLLFQNECANRSCGREINKLLFLVSLIASCTDAYVAVTNYKRYSSQQPCLYATVGIFFGTSVRMLFSKNRRQSIAIVTNILYQFSNRKDWEYTRLCR
jgi:hypothetical protein